MSYSDRKVWIMEYHYSPTSFARFIHREVSGDLNSKIKRVPFDWSWFGRTQGLTFNHHIILDETFSYLASNPLENVPSIKKGYFMYDRLYNRMEDFPYEY